MLISLLESVEQKRKLLDALTDHNIRWDLVECPETSVYPQLAAFTTNRYDSTLYISYYNLDDLTLDVSEILDAYSYLETSGNGKGKAAEHSTEEEDDQKD